MTYNNEMLDVYEGDNVIKIKKKNVLAISNVESVSSNTSNNDFIKFTVSDEMSGKGYAINIKENFINVVVGPEFNVSYGLVKNNNKDICTVFDSHLVFEVFVYLLVEITQDYEVHKNEEWYILFEQIFLQSSGYDDIETFINNVVDDTRIDMTQIFEVAQMLINNQLENTLIAVSNN